MSSSEFSAVRRHLSEGRGQRLGHVGQVGGESEQGEDAEADEEDAASGQHQEGADVVSVTDVLHLPLVLLLHQVAVLGPRRDLKRVLVHLRSATKTQTEPTSDQSQSVSTGAGETSKKMTDLKLNCRFNLLLWKTKRRQNVSSCPVWILQSYSSSFVSRPQTLLQHSVTCYSLCAELFIN